MQRGGMNQSAAKLRAEFDRAFAAAPATIETPTIDFLAIRAGGVALAIDLSEVAALVGSKRITRLPSARPDLLGVASLRGELIPVYSLGILAGGSSPGERPRWIALARHTDAIAFAFEEFEGHLRVPAEQVADAQDGAGRVIAEGAGTGGIRAVIRLAPLVEHIGKSGKSGVTGED
jgi:chemotaxis signal transduction protein